MLVPYCIEIKDEAFVWLVKLMFCYMYCILNVCHLFTVHIESCILSHGCLFCVVAFFSRVLEMFDLSPMKSRVKQTKMNEYRIAWPMPHTILHWNYRWSICMVGQTDRYDLHAHIHRSWWGGGDSFCFMRSTWHLNECNIYVKIMLLYVIFVLLGMWHHLVL
jgi:hypothetical protein